MTAAKRKAATTLWMIAAVNGCAALFVAVALSIVLMGGQA